MDHPHQILHPNRSLYHSRTSSSSMFSQLIHTQAAMGTNSYSTTRPAKDFGAVFGMFHYPDTPYGTNSSAACPAHVQVQSIQAHFEGHTDEFGASPPPYGYAGAPCQPKGKSGSSSKKSKGSLVSRGSLWYFSMILTCAFAKWFDAVFSKKAK